MGIVDRIKKRIGLSPVQNALAGYPRVTARISKDEDQLYSAELNTALRQYQSIAAKFPFQIYQYLDDLFLVDPYMAKYHQTTIALANTGHRLEITTDNENLANQAIAVANDLAARCYPLGGGMDGLVNGLLGQLSRAGGLCAEWVPNKKLTQVERAYIVPIKTLRFRRNTLNEIELCQEAQGQLLRLNPVQTSYHAVFQRDGNPYPIPPAISALESAAQHRRIQQSIGQWLEKLSSLGVLLAKVQSPPREPSETQAAYDEKAQSYLEKIASTIHDNFTTGMGISYDNIDFAFQNTNAGAQGAKDILQITLQGLFASLQRDPIFFGWNFNSTESWASVVYEEMVQGLRMFQLGTKRCLEHGHRLNLALNGLGDVGVSVSFNNNRSLDAFRDAQAKQMETAAIVSQYTIENPLVSYEEARKLLGHEDKAASSDAFVASFRQESKRYQIVSKPTSHIWVGIDNGPDTFGLETETVYSEYLDWLRVHLTEAGREGVAAVVSLMRSLRNESPDEAAAKILATYQRYAEGSVSASDSAKIASQHYNSVFEFAKRDALQGIFIGPDTPIPGTETFSFWDHRAIEYLSKTVDRFYVSKYVTESPARQDQIKNFMINKYLKGGEAPSSRESLDEFRRVFTDLSDSIGTRAARTIVDTGVSRARNWGHVLQLSEYEITEYRVEGPRDSMTCRWCWAMLGRVFATQKDIK